MEKLMTSKQYKNGNVSPTSFHSLPLLSDRGAVVDETESGVMEDVREGVREGMKEDVGEDVGGTWGKEECLWDKFQLAGAGNRVMNPGEERQTWTWENRTLPTAVMWFVTKVDPLWYLGATSCFIRVLHTRHYNRIVIQDIYSIWCHSTDIADSKIHTLLCIPL